MGLEHSCMFERGVGCYLARPRCCFRQLMIKSAATKAPANVIAKKESGVVFHGPASSIADSLCMETTLTKPKTPLLQNREWGKHLSLNQVAFLLQAKPSPRLIHSSLHSLERKPPPHLLEVVFTQWLSKSLQNVEKLATVFKNQTPWSAS